MLIGSTLKYHIVCIPTDSQSNSNPSLNFNPSLNLNPNPNTNPNPNPNTNPNPNPNPNLRNTIDIMDLLLKINTEVT